MSSEEFSTKDCPEVEELPKGWKIKFDKNKGNQVFFVESATLDTTWSHPTFGPLPKPWVLRVKEHTDKTRSPEYYNETTKLWSKTNPRLLAETLAAYRKSAPRELRIAANSVRNTGIRLKDCKRADIANRNIRDDFEKVHAIDPGDGTVGGMNGGVFVVRLKGLPGRLFIEKRFKDIDFDIAKKEIKICHHLKHAALTAYFAAFIIEAPNPMASLYVEFCDRGSLQDMINAYTRARTSTQKYLPPEAFVWHAFIGLCDGFAYLQGGRSFMKNSTDKTDPKWIPILHRDMKPDNILIKSRSQIDSPRYFYCVLSDFGLACEDLGKHDPRVDQHQVQRAKLGTKMYWAPELCYNPYPVLEIGTADPRQQFRQFPQNFRHSTLSDIWALGACIFNLCSPPANAGFMSHIKELPSAMGQEWYEGTKCRRYPLNIPDTYSQELKDAVLLATEWYPAERPDAIVLIAKLEELVKKSGYLKASATDPQHKVPGWATKVHSYHAKAERLFSKGA